MSTFPESFGLRLLAGCFRLLLYSYPAAFRREFGSEAVRSFEECCRIRLQRRGMFSMGLYALRSFWDALAAGALERSEERRRRAESRFNRNPIRTGTAMKTFFADLKSSWKALRRHPGYALGVVLLLALGIGLNGAVFNLADAILVRPLPFPEPQRLVGVWQTVSSRGLDQVLLSKPDFEDFRNQNSTFQEMAASLGVIGREWSYQSPDGPVQLQGCYVSANFFSTLGTPPLLGRPFLPEEDGVEGSNVTVLSRRLWSRLFGSDPEVIGRSIILNDRSYEVVGVMPSDFAYPEWAELWAPMGPLMQPGLLPQVRGISYLEVVGRLKPGVGIEKAQADLQVVAARLAEQYPASNKDRGARLIDLQEQLVGDSRTPLYLLSASVGFVLLIAAANAAALLLVRAAARRREFGIRAALGAGRGRLIRQSLTESGLPALLGGVLALPAAVLATRLILDLADNRLPRLYEVGFDWRMAAFVLSISLLTALLAGLLPALSISRAAPRLDLHEGGRGAAGGMGQSRLRGFLVTAQVALALLLLAGSGLLLRSLVRLQQVDPGFRPESVLVAQMQLSPTRYPDRESIFRLMQRLRDQASALPAVEAACAATGLPMIAVGFENILYIRPDELEAMDEQGQPAQLAIVLPGFFETMQIPLLQGRDFQAADQQRPDHPILVSRSLAESVWPGLNPLGQRLALPNRRIAEVIGVVGDVRWRDLASRALPQIYYPLGPHVRLSFKLVLRTKNDPILSAQAIEKVVRDADPQLPVEIAPMSQFVRGTLARPRFQFQLLGAFASTALLLSMVGLYGSLAYAVRHRRREMGIRTALGADRRRLLRLVLRQGMRPVAAGLVLGLAAALALARWMSGLLYEIQPGDPLTFTSAALLMLFVSLLACTAPARRASRVDAVEVLREE